MKKYLFAFVLFSLYPGILSAQSVPYEKYELPNGMTVILHEDHSQPTATINIWYYVGSKDEKEGRSGFAHLFEHLMFMGTERVPGSDFDNIMEREGGWNNATTSQDRTNYFSFGPSRLLPTLLWLDADRLQDLGRMTTQEKVDKQIDVVRNERRQSYENRPYGIAELRKYEMMYPKGHPYYHPVIGSHADLEAATVDDVKDFFKDYYVPSNASLVVAGDFDPEVIKPVVNDLFGTLPRGSDPVHFEAAPVELSGPLRTVVTDDVQMPRLYFVYHSPALFAEGDAELDLAAGILSSGLSSRLYQKLIYEKQLAVDVAAGQDSSYLGSLFEIVVTTKPDVDLTEVESLVDEVLAEIAEEGPTSAEVERHKARLEFRSLSSLESLLRKADALNRYQFYFGEPDSFQRDLDRYREATPEKVRGAIRRWLRPEARLVLQVLPEIPIPERDPRDQRPSALEERPFTVPVPISFKLSNGIEVHFWQDAELPLVELSVLFEGGSNHDESSWGRAALTAEMLDEGAGSRDAVEFSEALEDLGARLSLNASREYSSVGMSILKRNFEAGLGLVADAILRPSFEEAEWRRVQNLHIQDLRRQLDSPQAVAGRVGLEQFFGQGHPYGRPVSGTPESVESLRLEELVSWHQKLFVPSKATILVAGDLTEEELRKRFEAAFSGWEASAAELPPVGAVTSKQDELRVVLVDRPDAVQTVVSFMIPAAGYDDPDRVPKEMIITILGGSFTSRLNQNLRERNGYTYGAFSRLVFGEMGSYLMASSNVRADATGAALGEFLEEFRSLKSGDMTEDELVKARSNYKTVLLQAYSTLRSTLATAWDLLRRNRGFEAPEQDLERSRKVSLEQLNALADSTVPLERALLVLVGDRDVVLEQLRGLPLPAPVELTVEGRPVR